MNDQMDFEQLKEPLSANNACGESLEDTQLLASFDAYRLFGQVTLPDPAPDWREIKTKSLEALQQSKDIRLLAHLGAAVLRTDGLLSFCGLLNIGASWLEGYWSEVFPRIDEDIILRKNALSNFADRVAVVDRLRNLPLVQSRQLGSFSFRDIEMAAGRLPSGSDAAAPAQSQIAAAFASVSLSELESLKDGVTGALAAIKRIEAKMRDASGSDAVPDLDSLVMQLTQMRRVVLEQLAARGAGAAAESGNPAEATGTGVVAAAIGAIRSRQDAIRALDEVASFFRQHEPSSPVPLLLDRAKRLVAKDFLEVLADIAPDALSQARAVGGVKDGD